ncbi:hypothetical protein V8C37DRAFT_390725 [Trichoderma ceciliae]
MCSVSFFNTSRFSLSLSLSLFVLSFIPSDLSMIPPKTRKKVWRTSKTSQGKLTILPLVPEILHTIPSSSSSATKRLRAGKSVPRRFKHLEFVFGVFFPLSLSHLSIYPFDSRYNCPSHFPLFFSQLFFSTEFSCFYLQGEQWRVPYEDGISRMSLVHTPLTLSRPDI